MFATANANLIDVPEDAATIQAAFDASQRGDTIVVSNGIYEETLRVPGGLRTLASTYIFSGNAEDRETTVLLPADTVSADTACILLMMQPCSLRVAGLTFKFGRGVRLSNDRREGGAVYSASSNLHISDCEFNDCFADFGVCVWASQCEVTIRKTEFARNGRNNGVVVSQGCIRTNFSDVFVDSSRFSHNTVTGAPAMIVVESVAVIENCVVDSNNNPSASLGAITSDESRLIVRNSQFRDNIHGMTFTGACIMADGFASIENCEFVRTQGRGPLSLFGDTAIVVDCYLSQNVSNLYSPSCIAFGGGFNAVSRCSFIHNMAPNWSVLTANSTTTIVDCYFSENSSLDDSGAIASASSDSLLFANCTFENNSPYAFSTDFWWFEGFIDARNCYWGAPSGPYQEHLNPDGDGDAILGTDVLFDPWLEQSPLATPEERRSVVGDFGISKAYPNPFNSSVTIEYTLTREQDVRLEIFDVLGRSVEKMIDERQGVGVHSVMWNAAGIGTGLYFARLSSEGDKRVRAVKLMLLK